MKLLTRNASTLIAASLLACATTVQAGDPVNIITVSTVNDGIDEFDGVCSLREAIRNSNLNQSSPVAGECASGSAVLTDEIVLLGGATYTLTVAGLGSEEGDLDLFQNVPIEIDLRIRSSNANQVTIRQNVAGQRVIDNNGLTVDLQNLLIRGGNVDGAGGGILNGGGKITASQLNIFSNSATAGGGIYTTGRFEATNSQLQLNTASFIGGGAIYSTGAGEVVLDNVMLRANSAPAGGAIYNEAGQLFLTNGCAVSLNQATSTHGGAIFNTANGDLLVSDAIFENNTAENEGGGIFTNATFTQARVLNTSFVNHNATLGGAISARGTRAVNITNSTFVDNSSASDGGALRAVNSAIEGSRFENNTAFLGDGGAVFIDVSLDVSNNTVFRDNTASNGGAIHAQFINMSDSRVEMNSSSGQGGGIRVSNFGEISGSQIVGNSASAGAGLYLSPTGGNNQFPTEITRSLFMGNTATGKGGGLWLGKKVLIGNTTITLNGANDGGGGLYINDTSEVTAVNMTVQGHLNGQDLHKFGTLRLQNSIISTPGQPDCTTSIKNVEIISLGNNIADDASCFGLTQPSDRINTDPMLEPLADNGGSTMTFIPAPGSPARNAGSNAGCAAAPVNNVDQRKAPRPFASTCDIGAHEVGAVAPADLFGDGFE
jgi:predicted outer membrane repeat protein